MGSLPSPDAQSAAPWENVSPNEQLFVMITGANSGIGFGTCQRLIDEYLLARPPTAHLILLPTTRSTTKSLETVRSLREYAAESSRTKLRNLWQSRRKGTSSATTAEKGQDEEEEEYSWQETNSRIHILSPVIDLCDLRSLHAFARQLCAGTISNPPGLEGEYLTNVRIPRIDSLICNAAFGGWTGFSMWGAIKSFVRRGFLESITSPDFKIALPTSLLNDRDRYNYPAKPALGEVFTACIFGHYLLIRWLNPLLRRDATPGTISPSDVEAGKIVFCSSIEAYAHCFDINNVQAFGRTDSYESIKRLTDILALTYTLPSVRAISAEYLLTDPTTMTLQATPPTASQTPVAATALDTPQLRRSTRQRKTESNSDSASPIAFIPPRIHLTHPGIVASSLFPVPFFLFWAYELAVNIGRWLGSPWHNVNGYSGAKAQVWVTLTSQEEIASQSDSPSSSSSAALSSFPSSSKGVTPPLCKWGSSSNYQLDVNVKKTEVEGWGWEGRVEDEESLAEGDKAVGGLRKTVGRRLGAELVTERELIQFEELGRECWEEMERLRLLWEDLLDLEVD